VKIDQEYGFGIISIIISVIGLPLWYISYLSTRDAEISRKISSALNLLPHCGFDSEKTKHVGEILLQAQKAIDVQGNYNTAASLLNSLSGELYSCKPVLQTNPDLMIFTLLTMFGIFGIITILRHFKEKIKEKLEEPIISEEKLDVSTKILKTEIKQSKLKGRVQDSKTFKNIQILFFTPLFTVLFFPLVFVFLIPLILLRTPEFELNTFMSAFMNYSIPIITILSGLSLYYLRHSPTNALNKFKEEHYILNYNVMKYAFPVQIVFLVILFLVIKFSTPETLKITNDEATYLFLSFIYFILSVMISIVFFIAIQFNSQYRFTVAKAKCMLFTKSKNDLLKLKYLLHAIEYYNRFIHAYFKMRLDIKTTIVTKYLTDSNFKNDLAINLLPAFEESETKPLEYFIGKLKVEQQNVLVLPTFREQFITWSPAIVGIVSVVITAIQIFLNK